MKTKTFGVFLTITLLCYCVLLASCARMKEDPSSVYKPFSADEGYYENQLGDNVYEVSFQANTLTLEMDVMNYVQYRCAELTLAKGCDYFIVTKKENLAESRTVIDSSRSIKTNDLMVRTESPPHIRYTIKIFKLPVSRNHGGAYIAREEIEELEPKIRR